jgi:hypothetical protein
MAHTPTSSFDAIPSFTQVIRNDPDAYGSTVDGAHKSRRQQKHQKE